MKSKWILLTILVALLTLGFSTQNAQADGSVAGVVIDADGEPIAGASVSIMGEMGDGGNRPFMERTETDDNGEFGFEAVPAGNYAVTTMVFMVGYDREEIRVEDDEVTEVVLQLEGRQGGGDDENPGSVTVTVVNQDGDPVERANVTLMSMRMDRNHRGGFHRPMFTETDAEGVATFEEVRPGNYHVSAWARDAGMAMDRIEVAAGEETEVRLELHEFGDRGGDDNRGDGRRGRHHRHD